MSMKKTDFNFFFKTRHGNMLSQNKTDKAILDSLLIKAGFAEEMANKIRCIISIYTVKG